MLRFTQSMVLQRGEISDEDLGALRKAGFSDGEIIEIVANIAQNVLANYVNILSKTELDFPALADEPAVQH
jgi:alkylhydroperoxidase family enzyme